MDGTSVTSARIEKLDKIKQHMACFTGDETKCFLIEVGTNKYMNSFWFK